MHTGFQIILMLKTVLSASDTIPITMITLKSVLNTKLLADLQQVFITSRSNACNGQSIIAVFNRLMEEEE
jgi:hypothetical protein